MFKVEMGSKKRPMRPNAKVLELEFKKKRGGVCTKYVN